jgi:hypothetical protein
VWLAAALLLAAMLLLLLGSVREDSLTADEPAHITASYAYLRFRDGRFNPEHPPLIKMLAAAPLLPLPLHFPLVHPAWQDGPNGVWDLMGVFLFESGHDLHRIASNQRAALRTAAAGTALALSPPGSVPVVQMYQGRRQCSTRGQLRAGAERQRRHAPCVAAYCAVRTLYAQGMPVTAIARAIGISRPTVYVDLRQETPPGPKRRQWRPSAQVLTPYIPSLIRRWHESRAQTDSVQLWREMQALGYAHSARTVSRLITRLRRASETGQRPESEGSPYIRPQGPSPRAVSFAMVCPAAKRSRDAQTYLDQLCQMDTGIARAHTLIEAFLAIVRERRGNDLKTWMAEATHSGIAELVRFACGLQDDLSAVKPGLTLEWSNGVTEGQIHRLKLLKRQGYGRASFALLGQRVLQVA